jgi:hypothetical protein
MICRCRSGTTSFHLHFVGHPGGAGARPAVEAHACWAGAVDDAALSFLQVALHCLHTAPAHDRSNMHQHAGSNVGTGSDTLSRSGSRQRERTSSSMRWRPASYLKNLACGHHVLPNGSCDIRRNLGARPGCETAGRRASAAVQQLFAQFRQWLQIG